MLWSCKIETWKSRMQMHELNRTFRTPSQKVTISRHGTRAVLQRRWPAACQLLSGRAANSSFHKRPQGLRSRFTVRKFRLSPWKQPKTDHLLIMPPCPSNTHKTGCLFNFHGAIVCKWKHAFLLPIYPHQQAIEPNRFLLQEKKKWKKGSCWFNNWNGLCYLFEKGLTDFSFSASYFFHLFYSKDTH